MVGIPKTTPATPLLFELPARAIVELALPLAQFLGIDAALRAHTTIACKDLAAEISGVGAEFPLVNACRTAKGKAAFGH